MFQRSVLGLRWARAAQPREGRWEKCGPGAGSEAGAAVLRRGLKPRRPWAGFRMVPATHSSYFRGQVEMSTLAWPS